MCSTLHFCITAVLSTSHSYSAVRRVYTLAQLLGNRHNIPKQDSQSKSPELYYPGSRQYQAGYPEAGSGHQTGTPALLPFWSVRHVGDHWWPGMPGRIQINLTSSCFKVPTKLAIGIKATVEKGEEEGKSWTPRFIQFHYDCDQMRTRWLSFVSFVNWFVWPQKAALARHRWCCLCEV